MLNQLIEMHDSRVTDIRLVGQQIVLELDAYVHASHGRPGIDPGTGSSQRAELVFERARVLEWPLGSSLWITEGAITSTNQVFENELSIPFELSEPLEFTAVGGEGRLRIVAERAYLVLTGEPRLIEHFDGAA